MSRDCPGEAVELDQYGTLIDAALIRLGREAASKGSPTAGEAKLAERAMNSFQQRRIGRTDLQVSVLGLGGAPLGDLYE